MPSYTCDAVRDALIRLTGQLSNGIYGEGATYGPWVAGTPRGTWADQMGIVINRLKWHRTVPQDEGDEWADATPSNFDTLTDNCNPPPETLRFGQSQDSMQVQRRHLQ